MQNLAVNGYSKQQVIDALHSRYRPRVIKFRYDLLDKNEIKKATLSNVESGEIQMSSTATIKRTAKIKLRDDGTINWLSDKIQPFFMLQMPDSNWLEWSLGIFLLSSPKRAEKNLKIYREIEAYDGIQILNEDKFDYRAYFAAGTNYIDAVKSILISAGITKINLQICTDTLGVDREWDSGTEKIKVINDLLSDLNYTDLWVDEWGYFTAYKYELPSVRAAQYTYEDNELSIMYSGVEEELDLFSVPNKFCVNMSNSETDSLSSTYINSNANSPTSTVNRGRTIVSYETIDYVSSQSALDDYVKTVAYEANQIYGTVTFSTAIMPMHSFKDILKVRFNSLSIDDKYEEMSWILPLKIGDKMKHTVRKVVTV